MKKEKKGVTFVVLLLQYLEVAPDECEEKKSRVARNFNPYLARQPTCLSSLPSGSTVDSNQIPRLKEVSIGSNSEIHDQNVTNTTRRKNMVGIEWAKALQQLHLPYGNQVDAAHHLHRIHRGDLT